MVKRSVYAVLLLVCAVLSVRFVAHRRATVAVRGVVLDQAGRPVEDALVAVVHEVESDPGTAAVVRTGKDGSFAARVARGRYALTATAPGQTAAYHNVTPIIADISPPLTLTVGEKGYVDVIGHVSFDEGRLPSGALVGALRSSAVYGDVFYTEPDSSGHFTLRLPLADYFFRLEAEGLLARYQILTPGRPHPVVLRASRPGPAPQPVVDWVRKHAVSLSSVEPGHGFSDLAPWTEIVGDAKIVALGDAVPGTHESFQVRRRLFESLVEEKGFTLLALEADGPKCLALEDYVADGAGDPAVALAALGERWDTLEVLNLVRWMRLWNMEHPHKLHIAGFDVGPTPVFRRPGGPLPMDSPRREVPRPISPVWVDGAREWPPALWGVERQARLHPLFGTAQREQSLAESVYNLLDAQPGTRVVLLTNNFHASRTDDSGFIPLGANLGTPETFLSVGLVTDRTPAASVGAAFARTGLPLFLIDLRHLPAGPVMSWLSLPQPVRESSPVFPWTASPPASLAQRFDAVVFIAQSTPAQGRSRRPR